MNYVTYDYSGRLTGAYCQELRPEHADCHIVVTVEQRHSWVLYKANPDRDGLVDAGPIVPAPEPLVESVPMLNLHLVLIEDGHLSTVEQAIAAMPGEKGQRARAYWAKALSARRDNEFVNELWPDLYADEAGFDDAWRRAAAMNP